GSSRGSARAPAAALRRAAMDQDGVGCTALRSLCPRRRRGGPQRRAGAPRVRGRWPQQQLLGASAGTEERGLLGVAEPRLGHGGGAPPRLRASRASGAAARAAAAT
ncbi:unnamed protein product, partial [Prorocentrum cordatum]